MSNSTMKIIISLLALMILISVTTQIKSAFDGNYKTETALYYTAEQVVDFQGIYIRDESVIPSDINGVVSYPFPDGSKIGKDSIAAYVYDSEEAVNINKQISDIEKQIELLKKAQNPGTTEVAQPEFISKQIDQSYNKISLMIDKNDFAGIKSERENFLVLSNILQIVVGKEDSYNERIEYLQTQLDSLKAKKKNPSLVVKSTESGYFVSYVDGYEDKLRKKDINNLSVDTIKGIISENDANSRESGIGKIIYGYDWKMIGIVDNSKNIFLEDTYISIKLSSQKGYIKVYIDDIKETTDPNESIIILSCNKLTEELVRHRVERAELKLNEFGGIKVSRNAIRFNATGEKGVYVQLGQQVIFKKIDVIYDADDFVISKETGKKGTLILYDDVIVEGIPRQDEILTEETDIVSSATDIYSATDIVVGETTAPITEQTAENTGLTSLVGGA